MNRLIVVDAYYEISARKKSVDAKQTKCRCTLYIAFLAILSAMALLANNAVAAQGTWSTTGSLAAAQWDHKTTLLNDGKVLVVGWSTDSAELYDPATGTFSATGAMLTSHGQGFTVTRLSDGKVLVVGGSFAPTIAEIYDPVTGTFSATGDLHVTHSFHTATLLPDGRVLIAGGNDANATSGVSSIATAELYDPASGIFNLTGDLNVDRMGASASLLPDGRVLVMGGSQTYAPSYGYCLSSAELYNPTSGTFSITGSMIACRDSLWWSDAPLLPNGKVLIVGGLFSLASAELFDPVTETFSATGNMTIGRSAPSVTLFPGGLVLVAGGSSAINTTTNAAELYDPATGIFTAIANMAVARQQHAATLLPNGKVLVTGGYNSIDGGLSLSELFSLIPQITATSGPNGSIAPPATWSVPYGGNGAFTITPDPGYRLNELFIDGVKQAYPRNPYPFYNVQTDHTISATFAPNVYAIMTSVTNYDHSTPGNGSITVNGGAPPATVNAGASITFTITPDPEHVVYSVLVDGSQKGGITSYTFSDIQANHTIDVYIRPVTYTVTASPGAGGKITPAGTSTFDIHTSPMYTITPNAGYSVADVKVDNVSQGAISSYTFTDITRNHTIVATFAANNSYIITANTGTTVSISPSGSVPVLSGANQKFIITPQTGIRIVGLYVDGAFKEGALTSYTFYNVTADHLIFAAWVPDVYTINLTVAAGGSVTMTGPSIPTTTVNGGESITITVNPGANVTLTITPDAGRSARSLVDNGSYKYGITTYTLTNIRKDHTINVYFK